MSDDCFGQDTRGRKSEAEAPSSVTSYSTVTDDLDTICDILAEARRRYLLYHLLTIDGRVTELDTAVDAVWTYETAATEIDDPPREAVRIDLHHVHLPRLADAGIVDYDQRQGTIRFSGHPSLEEFLEHTRYKELD